MVTVSMPLSLTLAAEAPPTPHLELWSALAGVAPVLLLGFAVLLTWGTEAITRVARRPAHWGILSVVVLIGGLYLLGTLGCLYVLYTAAAGLAMRADPVQMSLWGGDVIVDCVHVVILSATVLAFGYLGRFCVEGSERFRAARRAALAEPEPEPATPDPTAAAVAALADEVWALRADLAAERARARRPHARR